MFKAAREPQTAFKTNTSHSDTTENTGQQAYMRAARTRRQVAFRACILLVLLCVAEASRHA